MVICQLYVFMLKHTKKQMVVVGLTKYSLKRTYFRHNLRNRDKIKKLSQKKQSASLNLEAAEEIRPPTSWS